MADTATTSVHGNNYSTYKICTLRRAGKIKEPVSPSKRIASRRISQKRLTEINKRWISTADIERNLRSYTVQNILHIVNVLKQLRALQDLKSCPFCGSQASFAAYSRSTLQVH